MNFQSSWQRAVAQLVNEHTARLVELMAADGVELSGLSICRLQDGRIEFEIDDHSGHRWRGEMVMQTVKMPF